MDILVNRRTLQHPRRPAALICGVIASWIGSSRLESTPHGWPPEGLTVRVSVVGVSMNESHAGDDGARLLVRHPGEEWAPPSVVSYQGEAHLQEVLGAQPSLIPGVGATPVAVREIQTGSGPLDVLVVDADGQVTIVECKLASNAQIRREIVGQVLDYASSLWRMPLDDLDTRWRQRHPQKLGILEALDVDGDDASTLTAAIQQNLDLGRFNVVLAVDVINGGLRRIVEFLNDRTAADLSVTAIQLRYAKHGDVEILVPTVYGTELAQSKAAKAGVHQAWTEEDVLQYLDEHWPEAAAPVTTILDAIRPLPGITYEGTWAATPSMIARLETPDGVAWPFVIYTSKKPHIRLNFHWMSTLADDTKLTLATNLAMIENGGIDPAAIQASGYKKKPSLPIVGCLDAPAAQQKFIAAITMAVSGANGLTNSHHYPTV